MEALVDSYAFSELYDALENDEQSADLAEQVYRYFYDKFEMNRGELEAFNRLRSVVEHADSWDPSLLRNNIFKAAHSLGIELPSHMF